MFTNTKAFSGFAAPDLDAVQTFYSGTLGLETTREGDGLLIIHLAGGRDTIVYAKPDFEPATYTILNFPVDDIDAAVDGLTERGVELLRYEGFDQDERGISRTPNGPPIAWFADPAGNLLAVLEDPRDAAA
jgi:catechol 2,3-dioxygenase-like lactoylglutathione lyase family enzyme